MRTQKNGDRLISTLIVLSGLGLALSTKAEGLEIESPLRLEMDCFRKIDEARGTVEREAYLTCAKIERLGPFFEALVLPTKLASPQ